jgi:hypothetical protein
LLSSSVGTLISRACCFCDLRGKKEEEESSEREEEEKEQRTISVEPALLLLLLLPPWLLLLPCISCSRAAAEAAAARGQNTLADWQATAIELFLLLLPFSQSRDFFTMQISKPTYPH